MTKGRYSHTFFKLVVSIFFLLPSNSRILASNSECEDAIFLTEGAINGTLDDDASSSDFIQCVAQNSGGKSLWYRVTGTGLQMSATTCSSYTNIDTRISVFSPSCNDLDCISGNDNDPSGCDEAAGASTVEWNSLPGLPYYIVVHGVDENEEGDFELTVSTSSTCADAYELDIGVPFRSSTAGASELAVPNDDLRGDNCVDGTRDAFGSSAIWFKVTGNGQTFEVSTCMDSFLYGRRGLEDNNGRQLQVENPFDTQIFVLSAQDCDSTFTCVVANDDFCDVQSLVRWATVNGAVYYVVVTGAGKISGDFGLLLTDLAGGDNPDNDRCGSNAVKLTVGAELTGDVTNVQSDFVKSCKDASSSTEKKTGIWFDFIGDGNWVEITTCDVDAGTIEDPQIVVYTGNCAGTASCKAVNDNDGTCGTGGDDDDAIVDDDGTDRRRKAQDSKQSSVIFETEENEQYRIFLSGFEPQLSTSQKYGIAARKATAPTVDPPPPPPCFSLNAYAFVKGKGKTQMKDLVVGDRILEYNGEYGTLYAIDHYHETELATFLQISYKYRNKKDKQKYSTDPLEMTFQHMVFLDNQDYPVPAQSVKVGDQLRSILGGAGEEQGSVIVTKIDTITRKGVINPLTKSGTIVVGDAMIVASTYSALFTTITATTPVGPSLLLNGNGKVQIMGCNNSSRYDDSSDSNAHFMVNNIQNIFAPGDGTSGIGRVAIAQATKTHTSTAATTGSPSPFISMMMAMLLPTTKISHQNFFHAILAPYRFVCSGGLPFYPIEMMWCQQRNSNKNYNENGVVWYGQLGRDLLSLLGKQ